MAVGAQQQFHLIPLSQVLPHLPHQGLSWPRWLQVPQASRPSNVCETPQRTLREPSDPGEAPTGAGEEGGLVHAVHNL